MNTIQEPLTSVFDANKTAIKQEATPPVGTDRASDEKNRTQAVERPESRSVSEQEQNFFEEIKENLKKINDFIPVSSTNLVFEFDELNEPPIVKVVDKENGETIREIPPKYFSDVSSVLKDVSERLTNGGFLLDKQV